MSVATGMRCPQSGLWRALDDCQVEIVISEGEVFPPCLRCGNSVEWDVERRTNLRPPRNGLR